MYKAVTFSPKCTFYRWEAWYNGMILREGTIKPRACNRVATPYCGQIRSNFLPRSELNSLAHINSQVQSNFSKCNNTIFQANYLHRQYLKAFAETHFFLVSDRINVKWIAWVDYIPSNRKGLSSKGELFPWADNKVSLPIRKCLNVSIYNCFQILKNVNFVCVCVCVLFDIL